MIHSRHEVSLVATRFADDFAALLRAAQLAIVIDCLEIFCAGTGQRVNADKTVGFFVVCDADAPDGAHRIKWLPFGRAKGKLLGRLLGVPFGPAVNYTDEWNAIAVAMFTQMRLWGQFDLSYRARACTVGLTFCMFWHRAPRKLELAQTTGQHAPQAMGTPCRGGAAPQAAQRPTSVS